MPQSPSRRPSRPRTLELVEHRLVGGGTEFVFVENLRPVVARQTARSFIWDVDASDPQADEPRHPPVPAGLVEAESDAQLAALIGLLDRAYHRNR
jgi:hypothetical protein